jgi:hypothetical protein
MPIDDRQILQDFASRMHEICDDMKVSGGHGRQAALGRVFEVTPKTARKWLMGIGYPEMVRAVQIANWADVNLTWLLQGVGPKRGTKVNTKALVIDEAVRSLPRELGIDLIDNLRAKLERAGKLQAHEPSKRYITMLDAYEDELGRPRH